jgi:hypothetical protein
MVNSLNDALKSFQRDLDLSFVEYEKLLKKVSSVTLTHLHDLDQTQHEFIIDFQKYFDDIKSLLTDNCDV